jgi:hypothetical protein
LKGSRKNLEKEEKCITRSSEDVYLTGGIQKLHEIVGNIPPSNT